MYKKRERKANTVKHEMCTNVTRPAPFVRWVGPGDEARHGTQRAAESKESGIEKKNQAAASFPFSSAYRAITACFSGDMLQCCPLELRSTACAFLTASLACFIAAGGTAPAKSPQGLGREGWK